MTTQGLINSVAHEVGFWSTFVSSKRFIDNWVRSAQNPELEQSIKFRLFNIEGNVADIGSGPVSILKGTVKNLTAIDPLAEFYKNLFDYDGFKITPPLAIRAEDLAHHFPRHSFDAVHCRNAVDHMQFPVEAISEMYRLVKPGGILIIHGFTNEGQHEDYQGFHQWNITPFSDENRTGIKIQNPLNRLGSETHTIYGDIEVFELPNGREWVIFMKRKPGGTSDGETEFADQIWIDPE